MLLNVRRAAKRAQGGEKIIGPTKTHATRRLSIDDVTLAVIDEHHARAAEWAEAAGVEADDDGFVLTWDPSGAAPANPDVITTKFARLTKKAGCPEVRFHDLRHVVATTLLAEGTDVATAAMRLGHASPVTTMRVYAHVLEAYDRKAAGVIGCLAGLDESRLVHYVAPPHLDCAAQLAGAGNAVGALFGQLETFSRLRDAHPLNVGGATLAGCLGRCCHGGLGVADLRTGPGRRALSTPGSHQLSSTVTSSSSPDGPGLSKAGPRWRCLICQSGRLYMGEYLRL